MNGTMRLFSALAALLLVSAAWAQDRVPHSVFSIPGQCHALSFDGADLSHLCAPELIQVSYIGGHMELFVSLDDPAGRFLVFSGPGETVDGALVQAIGQVTVGLDAMGDEISTVKAKGECRHGDPFSGAADFACAAVDADGTPYTLSFTSDGTAPDTLLD